MAERFFILKDAAYLYETKSSKLFRMEGATYVEICNPDTFREVRLHSVEITPATAARLSGGNPKGERPVIRHCRSNAGTQPGRMSTSDRLS
jgi:hypothetical protein